MTDSSKQNNFNAPLQNKLLPSSARLSLTKSSVDEDEINNNNTANLPRLSSVQKTFDQPRTHLNHKINNDNNNKMKMTGAPDDDSVPQVIEREKPPAAAPRSGNRTSLAPPNPKPVRIIEISSRNLLKNLVDKVMQKQRLTLKTDNLAGILSQVGSRQVVLLSIAGPSRQGKSFILSYMVKYLRSLSASYTSSVPQSDWMGKSRNESLRDGFGWKNGTDPETLGIWMWSEPFPLRAADGSEFDVLLMDTQGVFDSHTDIKDWSTIVGLSLLTSSCLIFNISKLLEENILNSLKKFMDFGLMARDSSSDEETDASKPFQKLVFLVRDWNCPDTHPYGVAGGAAYLDSKLNEETTEDGEEIRTQIKSCFEQLDCCLMSEPGKLVKLNSYDGSVAKMDQDFAANIKEFIEHLFRPSSLAPKNILGNPVTGQDLLVYFEQLVKVFNGGEMPSNQELTQATVNSCNQAVVNRCFHTYKSSLEQFQKPESRTFLLEEELRDLSDSASQSSLNQFESLRKMGSLQAIATAKGDLISLCDQFKNGFLVSNLNARNQQVQRAEKELQTFLETRLKELIATQSTGRDDFVSEDVFLTICGNCKIEAQAMLLNSLGLHSHSSLNALPYVDQQKLEGVTLAFIKLTENVNEGKKLKAFAYLKELVGDLTEQYKLKMGAIIANHKYWQERELQNEDSALRSTLLKELSSEVGDSSIFPQGEQQLVSATQKEYISAYNLAQVRNENFLMTCAQYVSDLSKLYVEHIEKHAMEGVGSGLEGRSMGEAHAEAVQDCTTRLKDFDGFARLAASQKTQLEADLHLSIEMHCLHLVEKWSPRKRQSLLKTYKERLNEAYGSGRNIFGDGKLLDLEEKHDVEKIRVMNNFTEFLSQLPIPQEAHEKLFTVTNVMLKDFETELENHMAHIREKEKLRVDALQATAQGFLSEAKTKFLNSAKANNRACLDQEAYQLKFNEARLQVVQNFQDKCHTNHLLSSQQALTEDLDNFIKSVPQFKTLQNGAVLEISGPSLKLSRELDVLDNILESNLALIKEVRFIASDEIALDENICSEFWLGKNLIMYTKKMSVSGSDRIIDVSGNNGKSAPNDAVPPTPQESGKNGQNGVDGEPGESGGNVVLLASTIINPHHLKIISNGGVGGSGGRGGDGSLGIDGVDGDSRFHLTLDDLEQNFPSPAKFFDQIEACVSKAKLSLARIAKGRHLKTLPVANSNNYCFELETEEGARLRYGFSQGKLKGLISGRSFYIWCQGAPGTNGQPGGFGGLGGRGGSLGNPGAIDVPQEVAGDIVMMRKPGYNGRSGPPGVAGKDGVCGRQGTDYAIVDPYAGLWIPTANLLSKRRFQGSLEMVVVEEGAVYKNFARCVNAWNKPFRWATASLSSGATGDQTEPSIPTMDDAAYCPHQSKYISFMSSLDMREVLIVYPESKETQYTRPLKKTRNKQPIVKASLVATYGKF